MPLTRYETKTETKLSKWIKDVNATLKLQHNETSRRKDGEKKFVVFRQRH
jgi:hypothetical protein